jgi:uncharacterized membrane protein HdeD (DUF308 family)
MTCTAGLNYWPAAQALAAPPGLGARRREGGEESRSLRCRGRDGPLQLRCGETSERNALMFRSLSTSLIVRGLLALAIGIIALAWPGVTVYALVILFAVFAFMAAGLQAMRAFSSDRAGPVIGHLLLGLADLAAGVIALAWPGPTALVLVLVVGTWAIIGGLVEFFAAFGAGESGGTRALSSSAGWLRSRSVWSSSPTRGSARSPWRCSSACST